MAVTGTLYLRLNTSRRGEGGIVYMAVLTGNARIACYPELPIASPGACLGRLFLREKMVCSVYVAQDYILIVIQDPNADQGS